ncbi:MAG: cell wall metabolism sensor histidine kinase WalK [Eubacteriaceae bacterium]|nr:cell wall metabolism sensor histidine kinase WalK [Eubacteriaceae bacterium]
MDTLLENQNDNGGGFTPPEATVLNKLKINMLLTNSAVLFVIILIVSVIIFSSLQINVLNDTDEQMLMQFIQLRLLLNEIEGKSQEPDLLNDLEALKNRLARSSLSYVVWDENFQCLDDHNVFADFDNLARVAMLAFAKDPQYKKNIKDESGVFFIHDLSGLGTNARIATFVTANDAGYLRVLQIVSNMDIKNDISNRLLKIMILTGCFGVIISFLTSYFITGRAMKPIEDNLRRQREFVADASHELRTPITVVRTNLDVALSSLEDTVKSQSKWLQNAYQETEHMEKLISDLLMLARHDLGDDILSYTTFNLVESVMEAIDRIKDYASNKGIIIELECSLQELVIHADKSKLQQLTLILLDNSIKYSPSGTMVIVSIAKGKFNNAVVSVSDEGIGIAPEDLKNIFERFYRSDKARSRREGGVGLGLAIAKWIVDAHKGSIIAESGKGEGTRMVVALPLGAASTKAQ